MPAGYVPFSASNVFPFGSLKNGFAGGVALSRSKAYQSEVGADAPLAYWKLDESSGTALSDSGPHGVTLSVANGAGVGSAAALPYGTALAFNNNADHVAASASATNDLRWDGQNLSIECWYLAGSKPGGTQALISNRVGAQVNEHFSIAQVVVGSDQLLVFDLGNGNAPERRWQTTYVPPVGMWTHIVFTYEAATKTRRLYVNGAFHSEMTIPSQAPHVATAAIMRLGVLGGSTTSYLVGSLDEVAIFRSRLTAARIARHYAARWAP